MKKFYENKIFIIVSLFLIFGAVAVVASTIGDSGYSGIQVDNYFSGSGKQGITQDISFNDSENNAHLLQFEDGLLVNYSFVEKTIFSDSLAYYKFDETSGQATDYTGNGYDGQVNGVTYDVLGILGSSYNYSTNSSVNLSGTKSLLSNYTGFSVSVWTKGPSVDSNEIIVGQDINYKGFQLYVDSTNGRPIFYNDAPGGWINSIQGTTNIRNGNWNHVVITYYPNTTANLWVNGDLESTGSGNYISQDEHNIMIGTYVTGGSSGDHWESQIDELGIWNRPLSQEEVQALYNDGYGLTYS